MSLSVPSGPVCLAAPHSRLGRLLPWMLAAMLAAILAAAPGAGYAQPQAQPRMPDEAGAEPAPRPHAPKPTPPHAPELTVASLGGGLQAAQQASLFTPFSTDTGTQIKLLNWDGSLATLQRRAQTGANAGNAAWDLLLMEEAPLRVACREGLLLPKPRTADPADIAPDSSGRDCGVAAWRTNLVLAWDKSRVDMTPTWADFWDVARRPGKRGLQRDPRGTLEIALMADGVAPEDVYRTLGTSEGVDRAFRKLDQLKPYIVWWNTPGEAVQIIESGAVLMTSAPSGEIATANAVGHRSFGMQWAQSLGLTLDWAVPRATTPEQRALAQKLLAFLADPARQTGFLASYEATPAGAQASPAAATGAKGPTGAPARPRATLTMDDDFWADHFVALRQRFDTWLAAK